MNSRFSWLWLVCSGICWTGTFLQATESSFSYPVTVTGAVADSRNTYSRDWTNLDGQEYTNCLQRRNTAPSIPVTIINTSGGPVNGTVTGELLSGKSLGVPNSVRTVNSSSDTAHTSMSFSNSFVFGWVRDPQDGEGYDFAGPSHGIRTVEGQLNFRITYTDNNGGGGDSMTVLQEWNLSIDYVNATNRAGDTAAPDIRVYLYVNGPPPEGRPAPGDGIEYDDTSEFNTNYDAVTTNNSGEQQVIQIWGPLGEDGAPVLLDEIIVQPGETINFEGGIDIPPGEQLMIVTSGETEGGIAYINEGEDISGIQYNFVEQDSDTIRIVTDAEFGDPNLVTIGNESSVQEAWVPPGGVSWDDYSVGGEYDIGGGEIIKVSDSGNVKVLFVEVPGGSGGTVTTVGEATVPTSDGGTQTVEIVEFPSGQTVQVPNTPAEANTNPPALSSGGNATGGSTVTTSSSLVDEAAQQLAQIRAEFAASSGQIETDSFNDLAAENAEATASVEGVIENVDEIFDDALTGDTFLFVDPDDFVDIQAGRISSVPITLLGNTYLLDFDHPGVSFLRTLFLFAASWAWFVFLIKFSRF